MRVASNLHVRLIAPMLALSAILALSSAAPAAYLENMPITLNQPDGTVINCFASGDEYYNWAHDERGYVIIQDHSTGYYVYAVLVNGDVAPSSYVVGTVDPESVGLVPGIRPDAENLQRRVAGSFPTPAGEQVVLAPQTGTLNNIVIFIRFSDQSEYSDQVSAYDSIFNNLASGANSMWNYFLATSYNALTIPTTFYPAPPGATIVSYQDSHPRGYYMPYDATTNPIGYTNDSGAREHALLANAVNSVNSQVPSSLNVDGDGDGNVDNVCFVVKGSSTAWGTLLWPHAWALYSQSVYINGKRVWGYNLQLSDWLIPNGVGVLCHEMMHTLGAPDLYHYTSQPVDPVGRWDVMAANANPPQFTCAYMKYKYMHWISSLPQITASGTYTVNPLASATGNCYKIASSKSATEFFVVEYRRKTGAFESSVPGSGLIVYRINTKATGNASGPPDEIYIYRPDGTTTVNGDLDRAYFSSTAGRTAINDFTNPSSFLSNGAPGGLNIWNVTSAGATISFQVSLGLAAPVISPAGGTYTTPVAVTIACPGGVGDIHYTTNGQDPAESDPFIPSGGTLQITSTCTLKARAYKTGYVPSEVSSASFTILNMTISHVKRQPDGTLVGLDAAVVTAAFPDAFYVEADDRSNGILVRKTAHSLTTGARAKVIGHVWTNEDGERCIDATTAVQNGIGSVAPLGMNSKAVGGTRWFYDDSTGQGQRGISGAIGLNNIGLLVRTAGLFHYIDSTRFSVANGARSESTCSVPAGVVLDQNWNNVVVTGISSCYKSGADTKSLIKIRGQNDILLPSGGMITGKIVSSTKQVTDQLVESLHPYPANADTTWTITGPPGTIRMRVHFTQIQLESYCDYLYVKDAAGVTGQTLTGTTAKYNVWSYWIAGDTIILNLKTDSSFCYYGFSMDKYEAEVSAGPVPGVLMTMTPAGLTTTTDADGVYFFSDLLAGTYTITPSLGDALFTPTSYSAALTYGQYMSGKNFTKN